MFQTFKNHFNSDDYKKGINEGFKIAESYIKEASKKFYKEMKDGLIEKLATTTTISTRQPIIKILGFDVHIDDEVPNDEIWFGSKKSALKLKILTDFEEIKK